MRREILQQSPQKRLKGRNLPERQVTSSVRIVARSARYEREASTPTLRAAPGTWVGLRLFRTPCDVASRRCLALRANVMTVSSPLATQTGRPRHFRKFL